MKRAITIQLSADMNPTSTSKIRKSSIIKAAKETLSGTYPGIEFTNFEVEDSACFVGGEVEVTFEDIY